MKAKLRALVLFAMALPSLLFVGGGLASAQALQPADTASSARARVITVDFVLSGRLERLARFAAQAGVSLEIRYVETEGDLVEWLAGADLIILDTPRPMDAAKVEQRLGSVLRASQRPWLRVGGGPPAFGNLPLEHARRLIAYYAGGGESNLRSMFAYVSAWRTGGDTAAIAAPQPLPAAGFYHPDAPAPFASLAAYLEWGAGRWGQDAPRVAIAIHSGMISAMETAVVDALITGSEARGLVPLVFWFEAADPQGVEKMLGGANADALVIATHLQNGPARAAEFLKLGIPVMQTISYRDGDAQSWAKSQSGISPRLVAPFLALPESWGVSDPVVIDAVESGTPRPIAGQVDALLGKVARLAALRRKPSADKRLAVVFWNYPAGEKNLSASHLNIPRSLETLTGALASAGYDVPPKHEAELIRSAQAMLGALYRPETAASLIEAGLAAPLPVSRYKAWLARIPAESRAALQARWGDPESDPNVQRIGGEKQFVIPRLEVGKLVIAPQPPRSGRPGGHYHDTKEVPGHFYMAAYLYLREVFGADALIHFGTHGTQEWMPGKDRGLSTGDFPYLAVGDLPVFYPYIQDNVAEALQAKRRGRAVTVSHQTPPFAPAGLYAELRDLHALIHEYTQIEDGAVRERTGEAIHKAATQANFHRDMGWEGSRIAADFAGFLSALHDHIHELARHAMPLGLHTFGEPASPEHRLATVMQQLGEPFYRRVGSEPDEFFAVQFDALQASPPYRLLHRHLREGAPLTELGDPDLRADLERAADLDRHLAETGEIEALLAGLSGRFVPPGPGGDPIRNPDVPSGRNLFALEPDKIPTRAAYEAGGQALQDLLAAYRAEHNGEMPSKLAFSLWGSETMRHLGVMEAQILHTLGLKPVWNDAGRLTALEVIPRAELGRPRIDTVLQVTSVYRDQFDGFMRMLAGTIERLTALDEPDSPIVSHSAAIADKLAAGGRPRPEAAQLASLRIFSNAPGDYGTGLSGAVLNSSAWEKDGTLAESYLARMQYAFGSKDWGVAVQGGNLFSEQLKGTRAAILSRSSKLHGVLSTDHPFEYLGGLSLAIRHLDGGSPSLYIADLREKTGRVASAARFLADEMRARTLNPHWITGMQKEGYAGTLELLNNTNNIWGWQVTAPETVRADQWQAVHDTYVRDIRNLGLAAWFEQHNPTAQAQIIERLVEAIRKGYWDAAEDMREQLAQRWQELVDRHGVTAGEPQTRAFAQQMASGFGLDQGSAPAASPAEPMPRPVAGQAAQISGQIMQPTAAPSGENLQPTVWLALGLLLICVMAGVVAELRSNARLRNTQTAT